MPVSPNYSFAYGGIIWRAIDRTRFEARSLRQRISFVVILALLCWLPIFILLVTRNDWSRCQSLFFRDVATHVRFLIVLPILLFSRRAFNKSIANTIHFFHETKIVDEENRVEFDRVMSWLDKWVKSKLIDVFLILLVYFTFYLQEQNRVNNSATYAPWHLMDDKITSAGWWYLLFSLPVFQLILFRWLYTIFLWMIFLRKISKLNLHLSALHPDGMAGLGFLQYAQLSFFPVALAFSTLAAGVMNNLILFSNASLKDYKIAIGSVLGLVFLLFILPLLQMVPLLSKIKRKYFMQYSLQAWPFARKYEQELKDYYETGEEKPDASWHVDLIGSFEKTKEMKIFLVDKTLLIAFALAVILPFLPVIAQQIPLKEIVISLLSKLAG